jgi:hypothetical protein
MSVLKLSWEICLVRHGFNKLIKEDKYYDLC